MNKADKELEVMKWMQKQGYDRRATQEIAPIIVKYIEQHGGNQPVSGSLPLHTMNLVKKWWREGSKLQAVKLVMTEFKWGPQKAKDWCDANLSSGNDR